jgi:hypothetical protein
VLSQNLVHGDALTMRGTDHAPIRFAELGYLGYSMALKRNPALMRHKRLKLFIKPLMAGLDPRRTGPLTT